MRTATTALSPCKVNFILNILGKRPDGFHELETALFPIQAHDLLEFSRSPATGGIALTCNHPELPTDRGNLVYRAAENFLQAANIREGVAIRLEKKLPLAAGLGGGSANAAVTLLGLNEIFGNPLAPELLHRLAAELGSDVPFFLQSRPALGVGRGEQVTSLPEFAALKGKWIILIHPGFGVSTPWAYKNLARFPQALNGTPGRAERLANALVTSTLADAQPDFYNSLEAPVLEKFPSLTLFQDCLKENGAEVALMSGSGSSTFAISTNQRAAETIVERFKSKFGDSCWVAIIPC
ncbi:MAG: 4-(cytidine 5'-diphospho)-2-C-methyl-D-erythritol kinase [Verrucomicrobiales bacterium]